MSLSTFCAAICPTMPGLPVFVQLSLFVQSRRHVVMVTSYTVGYFSANVISCYSKQ